MREFLDLKQSGDKDKIVTAVVLMVVDKLIAEQDNTGIPHSYNPVNITFSNFNPRNLAAAVVKLLAPITNRKSKVDGIFLAPEVLRGEGENKKSVVFTMGIIWDELIHYENYFKSIADIENLACTLLFYHR